MIRSIGFLIGVLALLLVLPASAVSGDASQPITSIEEAARQQLSAALERGPLAAPEGKPKSAMAGVGAQESTAYRCLPSCAADDGRFLAVAAGAALVTLSNSTLDVQVASPGDVGVFALGIFDGDANALGGNWDVGGASYTYTLYADAARDGSDTTVIAGPFSSTSMVNNDWFDFSVVNNPAARAPSGNYFYRLRIEDTNPLLMVLNSFKLRTDGVVTIEVNQQPFGFYAALQSASDAAIIFPDFPIYDPDAAPGTMGWTTYDGTFDFFINVTQEEEDLAIWGGDLDRGTYNGTDLDTDDLDTPNAPFVPEWATDDTVPEGVATGMPGTTGSPADDSSPTGMGFYLVRPSSIEFSLEAPDGMTYNNFDPSGNQEWEQYRLTTGVFDPATADAPAAALPAGIYTVRLRGVDMQNLNFWRFFHPLLCVDDTGTPCEPLRSFLLGDTVWEDLDGDGVQSAGEPGIEGVVLELRDDDGDVIATTVTDAEGVYALPVDAGIYSVSVAASNFDPGAVLDGLQLTSIADQFPAEVVDDNILNLDFGYRAVGSIGNFVWYDTDGDGFFDEDPGSGLADVVLTLTEAGDDGLLGTADDRFVGTQTTDAFGAYDFLHLRPGLYWVDVDGATVPQNLILSTAADPFGVLLGGGEDFDDADFGYAPDIAGCGACDGGVSELTLRYLGATDGVLIEAGVSGGGALLYSGVLDSGDVFSFTGQSAHRAMGAAVEIFADGRQAVVLDTSCATPIGPGAMAGDFMVLAGRSCNAGALCPVGCSSCSDPGPGPCSACDGQVTALTFEYLGTSAGFVEVYDPTVGDLYFADTVFPGETFSVAGAGENPALGPFADLFVNGSPNALIDTTCLAPIGPGLVAGDFLVVAGTSSGGGELCPLPDGGGGGDDDGSDDDGGDDDGGSDGGAG